MIVTSNHSCSYTCS